MAPMAAVATGRCHSVTDGCCNSAMAATKIGVVADAIVAMDMVMTVVEVGLA